MLKKMNSSNLKGKTIKLKALIKMSELFLTKYRPSISASNTTESLRHNFSHQPTQDTSGHCPTNNTKKNLNAGKVHKDHLILYK